MRKISDLVKRAFAWVDRLFQAVCRILPKPLDALVRRYHRLLTFGFIGVINTSMEYLMFFLLFYGASCPIRWSQAIGYLFGSACGYLNNSNTTFREGKGRTRGQFAQYLGLDVFLAIVSAVFMDCAEHWGIPILLLKICVTIVMALLHYTLFKLVVFRIKKEGKQ